MIRAPGAFDTFLCADYSGAESAATQRAAIALARFDRGDAAPRIVRGPFTRDALRARLVDELALATDEGRRVLFGIDHQWSWPVDLWRAAGLSGVGWRRAVAALARGRRDLPALTAPRLYARAFNAAAGANIFHSRVRGFARRYGIPVRPSWNGRADRPTENVMSGAKPAHRLGGAGAVGGQTIEGLRQLALMFDDLDAAGLRVRFWPFDAGHDDGRAHVGCEIYPGFCKKALNRAGVRWRRATWTEHEADAAAVCLWASRAPLEALLDLRAMDRQVLRRVRLEGWILGAVLGGVASSELARTTAASPKRSRS